MVRQYEYIIRSQIVGTAFSALGGAATITLAQIYFLKHFVEALLLSLVLPVGIVLRSLPFARGIGSALIAIALGLYFVYPLTLVLNSKIVAHARGDDWYKIEIIPAQVRDFLGAVAPGAAPAAVWAARSGLFALFRSVYSKYSGWFVVGAMGLLTYHTINLLYEYSAFAIVVFGALLPFLSVVITFGITRELGALLGADIELSTLMRIL